MQNHQLRPKNFTTIFVLKVNLDKSTGVQKGGGGLEGETTRASALYRRFGFINLSGAVLSPNLFTNIFDANVACQ